jgi:hypothetical protein
MFEPINRRIDHRIQLTMIFHFQLFLPLKENPAKIADLRIPDDLE